MARTFQVPSFYRSSGITAVKLFRKNTDAIKTDFRPSMLDFGPIRFKIARHFGFCFGVENAIEIAYRALEENKDCRIFLLSEMIHNPQVNADLKKRGVRFILDTSGSPIIPFSELASNDIVIVPAFGTTVELQQRLSALGINPYLYDTTCPFVEKVWRRSAELGKSGFSVLVHGKKTHEETRATFSHSQQTTPTIVILDMKEAMLLTQFMRGELPLKDFNDHFKDSMSESFNPEVHLQRLGVVNQTTMLATETQAIADHLRQTLLDIHGADNLSQHFADTRDTLCYATHENQRATEALIQEGADIAIVVGGYNSSNTSHLVELCDCCMPTYYIKNADEIINRSEIKHFSLKTKVVQTSCNWLPETKGKPLDIALTSGASCPDITVDQVIQKIAGLYEESKSFDEAFSCFQS